MKNNRIDSLVYRLISGQAIYLYKDLEIVFNPPSLSTLNWAELHWKNIAAEVRFNGWPTYSESEAVAIELGLWSKEEKDRMEEIKKKIDDTKEMMYENFQKGIDYKILGTILEKLKIEYDKLTYAQHCMDYITLEGYADAIKNEMVFGKSLHTSRPLGWKEFRDVLHLIKNDNISEVEYRQVVRSKEWLSYWMTGKERIFNTPLCDFNHEQRAICNFARMYDNAYQAMDAPDEEVMDNPDLFDGWLISRKKKEEAKKNKKEIDKIVGNAKASHVFVVANDKMTPQLINSMNRGPLMTQNLLNTGKINGQKKAQSTA